MAEDFAGHNEGPWHVVPYGDGDSLVVCAGEGPDWRICFMATPGDSPRTWASIIANARLIAAAPTLLARVLAAEAELERLRPLKEAAEDYARSVDEYPPVGIITPLIEAARAYAGSAE